MKTSCRKMLKRLLFWFTWPYLVTYCGAAKILAIIPTPFYSHQSVFRPLWLELASLGHHVTLITTNPMNDPNLFNLKEIDLSFTYKLVFEEHQMEKVVATESNILVLMKHMFDESNNMTVMQLRHEPVQKLIRSNETFNLVIVEAHVPAWFGFAAKYKCPVIAITSLAPSNHWKRIVGNLNNPAFSPHFNLPYDDTMSFLERLISVAFELIDELQLRCLLYPYQQAIIRKELNIDEIDIWAIHKNVSLIFTTIIPGFSKGFTQIPTIIPINGLQISPVKPIPNDVEKFLDSGINGVIYVSLGSLVKSIFLNKQIRSLLFDVFSKLPYKILWKFEEPVASVPKNVKMINWAPQQDILRHKNVKLFIMQGGLQSIDEAIRFQVPLLVCPFVGDMFSNAKRVKFLELGIWIDLKAATAKELNKAILDTINNERYSYISFSF